MGDRLRPLSVRQCDIEPEVHGKVYRTLQALLETSPLKRSLNFVIVKSSSDSLIVILNVTDANAAGRPLNQVSKKLTAALPEITGLLLVEGREDDTHYLDQNIVSFRNRLLVTIQWGWLFLSNDRSARLITGEVGTEPCENSPKADSK